VTTIVGTSFTYVFQVLAGEIPFPCLGMAAIFFIQRRWDGEMKSRPRVAEVVSQLERAAAGWGGVTQPCTQVECIVSVSLDAVSDSMAHGGPWVLILL